MTEPRRRRTDRGWRRLVRENWYRDVWLFIITGLVLIALANISNTAREVHQNQQATTEALCAFRDNVQRNYDNGVAFLQMHPNGIPGIPAKTLQVSLHNQKTTLAALSPLAC